MKTEDFLDILDDRDLVSKSIVRQLRNKVAQGDRRITPKSILKYLVKKELVTRTQAKELLETTLTVSSHAESSILGMVPMPKTPLEVPKTKRPAPEKKNEEIPTLDPVKPAADQPVREPEQSPVAEEPKDFLSDSFVQKASTADDPFAEATESQDQSDSAKPRRKRKQAKKNEWDSSLILVGGGGLALLVIIAVVVGLLIYREDADAVLAEAGEFFDGGSYTQAVKRYEHFVENFPRHADFSAANVRLGMARLWQVTSGIGDFRKALQTAQEVLDDISDEAEFHLAQRDLASRLPVIAKGLASQAERETDREEVQELIDKTNVALSLCSNTKYIPKTFRDPGLEEVNQTLERIRRGREQNASLASALSEIDGALAKQDVAAAYELHRQVIREHAGLLKNKTLRDKVQEISSAEQAVIQYVAQPKAADKSPRPSNVQATFALADWRSGKPAKVEEMVAARVGGAVYGLDGKDGTLRWRHFVGANLRSLPVVDPEGDVVVVDSVHGDLLKLSGHSAKVLWRLELGAQLAQPVLYDQQLLVGDDEGRLHFVDLATGERTGFVQFGQPLHLPPVADASGKNIYLVGEHSSLYTISAEDFSCRGVFFLGHAKGGVSTAPVTVLDKVVAAVNVGLETSQVHVLATAEDGRVAERVTTKRLDGLIQTPLLVAGRRFVAVTTHGQIQVYEANAGQSDGAVTEIASRRSVKGPPIARYGLVHQGHVWLAGEKLSKLAVLPTGNQLQFRTVEDDNAGDIFDHALMAQGDVLFHVRRPRHQGGAIVGAMDMGSGKTLWETELGVPLAGSPRVNAEGDQITAVTASGNGFVLDREAFGRGVQNEAHRLRVSRQMLPALTETVDLGQGQMLAAAPGAPWLLSFRTEMSQPKLKRIRLEGPLSVRPVVWGEAVVAPTRIGQVFLLSADEGKSIGAPYQPALGANTKYDWLAPAVFGSGDTSRLLLSDGKEKIVAIARVVQPKPHLQAVAEADVSAVPLNTPLAVVGDVVCAGSETGQFVGFSLPALDPQRPADLGAQVTWGPFSVGGEQVVIATDSDELVAMNKKLQITWRKPFVHGPPAGRPLADEGELLLAWKSGGVSRMILKNGEEAGFIELGEPLVSGPVVMGKRLVVATSDGTLLVVDRP